MERNRVVQRTFSWHSKPLVLILLTAVLGSVFIRSTNGSRAADELDTGFVVTEESEDDSNLGRYLEEEDGTYGASGSESLTVPVSSSIDNSLTALSVTSTPNKRNSMESRALPVTHRYWGCYEYRSGNLAHLNDRETSKLGGSLFNPGDCASFCQLALDGFGLYMVKGAYCECSYRSNFTKSRVNETFCNLPCPHPLGWPEESCGGNLAVSIYCSATDPECTSENIDAVKPLSILVEDSAWTEGIQIIAWAPCAICTRRLQNDEINCFRLNGFSNYALQEYFPLNSPIECIKYCRSNLTDQNGVPIKSSLAIIGWLYVEFFAPTCMCGNVEDGHYLQTNLRLCNSVCPGEPMTKCGDSTEQLFSVYCTEDGPFCGSVDDDGTTSPRIGNDTSDWYDETIETTWPTTESTVVTETLPPVTLSTTSEVPLNTTTTQETTTTSTSTPTPVPTTLTTTTSTSTPTPVPTTLTTTARTTTSTASTTTTQNPNCQVTCKATDHYGDSWIGCGGQLVSRLCGFGKKGKSHWLCLSNGTFSANGPDFRECKTPWQEDMWEEVLSRNETLSRDEAVEKLSRMQDFCKVSSDNRVPYYGHEIPAISRLILTVVNLTNGTYQDREVVIKQAVNVPQIMFMNSDQWRELDNVTERAGIASELLHTMEESAFTLVGKNVPEKYVINFHPENTDTSQFLVSFGTGRKSSAANEALQFPLNPDVKTSFIMLDEGWENLTGDSSYVGMSIHPDFVKSQFSTHLFSSANSNKVINANMLSLTLAGLGSSTKSANLQGKKARITFQHEAEAWGQEQATIYRKLHPGETPKVSHGGAACVYWSLEKLKWLTSGCKIVESTRTYTICECDHLTSFAVLMDSHNYVGKDKILEILTIILCSFSIMSLVACIIIFSSLHSIKSQRTTITKHLCICLTIGVVLLLLFVDRNYFYVPDSMCIAIGIGTHYIYLASFMWMLIEGFHLYKMVVHVFDSGKSHTTIYRILAYGVPIIIVGITCVIGILLGDHPYRGDTFCWLEGPYIWAFMGPVGVVIIINIIILFVALKAAYQMQATTAFLQNRKRSYRTWIRGSFSITVILGITWLPGFFMISPSPILAKVSGYIFVFLNASQGIFLFSFHCAFNEKVRMAAQRNMNLPSWLSLSQNSTPSREFTQSGKRSINAQGYNTASFKSSQYKDSFSRVPVERHVRNEGYPRGGEIYKMGHEKNSSYDSGMSADMRVGRGVNPEDSGSARSSDSSQRGLVRPKRR